MKKILFLVNTISTVSFPVFKKITEQNNIKYIITNREQQKYYFKEEENDQFLSKNRIQELPKIKIKNKKSELIKTLLKEKYDVFIGGEWDSIKTIIDLAIIFFIVKIIKRKKWIVWNGIRWRPKKYNLKLKLVDYFVSKIIQFANLVIVGSTLSENYVKQILRVNNKKIEKKLNITEIWVKQKKIEKKYETILKKGRNIVFIGRATIEVKGIPYLIKAFKKIQKQNKSINLIIVGNNKDKFDFKENIYLFKSIPPEKISQFYKSADVVVLPSIQTKNDNIEGWGLVVNEAYQFGKPVVVTNKVGCWKDIVKNNVNGFVVPDKNSNALAKAISKILNNKELSKKMSKNNKKLFEEKLRYENDIEKWNKILRKT